MSYINNNKAAWEEAFEHRTKGWGDDNDKLLKKEPLYFFHDDIKAELRKLDLKGKSAAQFCCNNGREILSLVQEGIKNGVGFDIAENIIEQAKITAQNAEIKNCDFVACNILEIPEEYNQQFDLIFFTIGAITWFQDLNVLFRKVADCLKPNGFMFIHDFHPLFNMLPLPNEEEFDENNLNKLAFSYFRKEPWIETSGVGYISGEYESKVLTSYSHTMSDIINALSNNGLMTVTLSEYDYDIGLTEVYNKTGFPLSFYLLAKKYESVIQKNK